MGARYAYPALAARPLHRLAVDLRCTERVVAMLRVLVGPPAQQPRCTARLIGASNAGLALRTQSGRSVTVACQANTEADTVSQADAAAGAGAAGAEALAAAAVRLVLRVDGQPPPPELATVAARLPASLLELLERL